LYIDALSEIESVEVVDDLTVQFNLTIPSSTIFFNGFSAILILPQHIWENVVEENSLEHPAEWTELQMIGSGPFMVDNIVYGEVIDLVRNDDFWGDPSPSERMLTYIFADSPSVFRALQDGTVYFHQQGALAPDALQQVDSGAVAHLTSGEVGSTSTRGFAMRTSEGSPFRDYWLRLAIAHTVDKAFSVDVGNRGFAAIGAGTISPDNEFWFNPNIPQENGEIGTPFWPQLDMERARQILTDAGYTWDDQGRLHYPSADYEPQVHFDGSE
jgi:peptide/nickel transport system substrate-binding protein